MEVSEMHGLPFIQWSGRIRTESWFQAEFDLPDLNLIKTNDSKIAEYLLNILKVCKKINPAHFNSNSGYQVITNLDFDINWGLGSSSSLLSNIAYWLELDPFELYFKLFSGSAYDIACARSTRPVLYKLEDKLPVVSESHFNPPFRDKLYFIYLGRKQNSAQSVGEYLANVKPTAKAIDKITELTEGMARTFSLEEFEHFMQTHEEVTAALLNKVRIKTSSFPDFKGEMKSLGAWGGDFILASWAGDFQELKAYFHSFGLDVIFPYSEMIYREKKIHGDI